MAVKGGGYSLPYARVTFAAPQPVTGTFWPTTQPVSGTVIANVTFPTTQQVVLTPGGTAAHAITPKVASNVAAYVASTVACNFYGGSVVSSPNGVAAYVMALNRSTIPTAGTSIVQSEILALSGFSQGGGANLVPDQFPDRFSVGCVIVVSTSTTTYTPPTSNLPLFIKARLL